MRRISVDLVFENDAVYEDFEVALLESGLSVGEYLSDLVIRNLPAAGDIDFEQGNGNGEHKPND